MQEIGQSVVTSNGGWSNNGSLHTVYLWAKQVEEAAVVFKIKSDCAV